MSLDSLQQHWEKFARQDPMWAILTEPGKENRAWNEAEFFRTGVEQIHDLMDWIRPILPLASMDRVLDFGSGMGRLTQALAARSGHVTGVDISSTMVELASSRAERPSNCDFVCNQRPDLAIFEASTFDFIHTSITLQHMAPRYSKAYLTEFARILKPGGALYFQMPVEAKFDRTALHRKFRTMMQTATSRISGWLGKPVMEMHGMEETEVRGCCLQHGLAIVALRTCGACGPGWRSFEYLAVKQLAEPCAGGADMVR